MANPSLNRTLCGGPSLSRRVAVGLAQQGQAQAVALARPVAERRRDHRPRCRAACRRGRPRRRRRPRGSGCAPDRRGGPADRMGRACRSRSLTCSPRRVSRCDTAPRRGKDRRARTVFWGAMMQWVPMQCRALAIVSRRSRLTRLGLKGIFSFEVSRAAGARR